MVRKSAFLVALMLLGTMGVCRANVVTFKIATLSPDGSFWMRKMHESAQEIAKKTNGQVRFKFYPGGVMGDDRVVLRKIRFGQLQGGMVVSGSLCSIYPGIQVYNLPFLFRNYAEVDYVRAKMDPVLEKGIEKAGFVTFGFAEGGFAYVMSQEPVRSLEDLRHQKVWIPQDDQFSVEMVKAFGVSPIPLSIADVRAGLQTGLINTVTTSPIAAIALQWHTQVKYLTQSPLLYIFGVLAVDGHAFSRLSPGQQTIVREVMGKAFAEIDHQNRIDNVKALEALRNQGITFVEVPKAALDQWRQKAGEVTDRLIKKDRLSREIVTMVKNELEQYRRQHP
jgi:TRAP-type transport system periplasmic protein